MVYWRYGISSFENCISISSLRRNRWPDGYLASFSRKELRMNWFHTKQISINLLTADYICWLYYGNKVNGARVYMVGDEEEECHSLDREEAERLWIQITREEEK